VELLAVAFVMSAHGVKGEMRIRSFSGSFGHLEKLAAVIARKGGVEKRFAVESTRRRDPDMLMKLAGVDTREAAQELAGFELWVGRESAAPLGAGEYYAADLCGCRLYFGEREIGTVSGLLDTGAAELLEVVRTDGTKALVPFVDHFIGEVDVAAGRIMLKEEYILL
jgi:16S rRNA processing protein RimM